MMGLGLGSRGDVMKSGLMALGLLLASRRRASIMLFVDGGCSAPARVEDVVTLGMANRTRTYFVFREEIDLVHPELPRHLTSKDEYAKAVLKILEGLAKHGDSVISRVKRGVVGDKATMDATSGQGHSGDQAECVAEKTPPLDSQGCPGTESTQKKWSPVWSAKSQDERPLELIFCALFSLVLALMPHVIALEIMRPFYSGRVLLYKVMSANPILHLAICCFDEPERIVWRTFESEIYGLVEARFRAGKDLKHDRDYDWVAEEHEPEDKESSSAASGIGARVGADAWVWVPELNGVFLRENAAKRQGSAKGR
ncbi:unnamed protein product [Sphacelaria rigidula]